MNLIYQFWDGEVRESARAGSDAMREYAKRIGVEYLFEENPQFMRTHFGYGIGAFTPHHGAFKPVFDESFDKYDKILFVDTDVFPVNGLTLNIFDEFTGEIGICNEPFQPKQRLVTKGKITGDTDRRFMELVKEVFGKDIPLVDGKLPEVFNTGMVLWSKEARLKARDCFIDFREWVGYTHRFNLPPFYTCDQPYLHAMMFAFDFDVQRMDGGWNSYIHGTRDIFHEDRYVIDWRNEDTKFVHCQFPGADDMNAEQLWKVVNCRVVDWDYSKLKVVDGNKKS